MPFYLKFSSVPLCLRPSQQKTLRPPTHHHLANQPPYSHRCPPLPTHNSQKTGSLLTSSQLMLVVLLTNQKDYIHANNSKSPYPFFVSLNWRDTNYERPVTKSPTSPTNLHTPTDAHCPNPQLSKNRLIINQ